MKYIYNEENKELIDKLRTYKLNKIDEKQIIGNFLRNNKLTSLKCLLERKEDDQEQEMYRWKYIRTLIAIGILTVVLIALGIFSFNYLNAGMADVLNTN